jgi:hypothetical protein
MYSVHFSRLVSRSASRSVSRSVGACIDRLGVDNMDRHAPSAADSYHTNIKTHAPHFPDAAPSSCPAGEKALGPVFKKRDVG